MTGYRGFYKWIGLIAATTTLWAAGWVGLPEKRPQEAAFENVTLPLPAPLPFPMLTDLERAIQQGNVRGVTEILARIEDMVQRTGMRYVPEIAMALWQSSLKARERGDMLVAEQCAEIVMRLEPTNPYYPLALARLEFHRGPAHWKSALRLAIRGIQAIVHQPRGVLAGLHLVLAWLEWVGFILLVAGGALALLWGGALFCHDALERCSTQRETLAWGLVVFTLTLPMMVVGALWGLVWWGLVLGGYMLPRPRRVFIVLLGALAPLWLLTYGLYGVYERYAHASRPWILLYYRFGTNPSIMYAMFNHLQRHPTDLETLLLYGHMFTEMGRYREAEAVYRLGLRMHGQHPAILNNLGNVFYFQENPLQAIEYYRQAERQNPEDPVLQAYILYNQAQALRARLNFAEAQEKIRAAFQAYPALSGQVTGRGLPFDYIPPADAGLVPGSEYLRRIGQWWFQDRRLWTLALMAGLWGGLRWIRWPPYRARRCVRCGVPHCPDCIGVDAQRSYCSQCLHLFILRDGVSPEMRQEKLRQIERRERGEVLATTVLDLAMPGSGQWIQRGRGTGLLRMGLWAMALSVVLTPAMTSPWLLTPALMPVLTFAGLVLIFGVYIMNLIWVLLSK